MNNINNQFRQNRPHIYQIQVQGRISEQWSRWFDGMTFEVEEMSDSRTITTVTGAVIDQAALIGLLQKLYNLGFVLLDVRRKEEI